MCLIHAMIIQVLALLEKVFQLHLIKSAAFIRQQLKSSFSFLSPSFVFPKVRVEGFISPSLIFCDPLLMLLLWVTRSFML